MRINSAEYQRYFSCVSKIKPGDIASMYLVNANLNARLSTTPTAYIADFLVIDADHTYKHILIASAKKQDSFWSIAANCNAACFRKISTENMNKLLYKYPFAYSFSYNPGDCFFARIYLISKAPNAQTDIRF